VIAFLALKFMHKILPRSDLNPYFVNRTISSVPHFFFFSNKGLHKTMRLSLIIAILFVSAVSTANPPPLREEILLNGWWTQGGTVPSFSGETFTTKTYVRSVTIPSSWAGKTIRLEFKAVNYIASVYINGKNVQTHIGGWVPFTVIINHYVKAGSTFELKIIVKGRMSQPYVDSSSKPQWPFGDLWTSGGDNMWSGIRDDVWMRAYGYINIYDTYIQTSWRNKELILTHTLFNKSATTRTIVLGGYIVRASTGLTEKTLTPINVTLIPGERRVVTTKHSWTNATLWWPDQPELYHLVSTITLGGKIIDRETRRFGFREIWSSGNKFYVNGTRVNFRGDFVEYGQDFPPEKFTKQNWPSVVDDLKRLNINIFRLHKYPAPSFCYDIADEKGLFIINESAINGDVKHFMTGYNPTPYFANAKTWISEWIRGSRNHPSIVMWSAVNEMFFVNISNSQCTELANDIKAYDSTRPILFCGERDKGQPIVDYHYPRASGSGLPFNSEPYGWENGIYGWSIFIRSTKPTCASECMNVPGRSAPVYSEQRNMWWHGIFPRGMRYVNWALISPGEAYNWILKEPDQNNIKIVNYRNAFNPVALFDKGYDNLGLTPFVTGVSPGGTLPAVDEGAVLNRTLVLYNDEFRNTSVTISVQIKSGSTVYATGTKTYTLALGEHLDIPCSFQVPFVGGNKMSVTLSTKKGSIQKFSETRQYTVTDKGRSGTSSPTVTFGGTSSGIPYVRL
jgi:hypothetical protein